MHATTSTFVHRLLEWPLFQSEWVFWLLFALSAASVAVILERVVFFRRHAPETARFAATVEAALGRGDYEGAARALTDRNSLEARVLLAGLVACEQGPDAVEFNAFKNAVKARVTRAETLSRTLLSRLKGELPAADTKGASLRATAE